MSDVTTNVQVDRDHVYCNQILHLREWGAERRYPLPSPPTTQCSIGTAEACTIQVSDASVSSMHAHLRRDTRRWSIRTLDQNLGLRQDGARCDAFALEPGVEIGMGGLTLVAESRRSVTLRAFCARIQGRDADRAQVVDLALRSIRQAATHRTALWLCGKPDLVPLAHSLHRRAYGADRPFVVCDRRRRAGKESVRTATNCMSGTAAAQAAVGGSVCVRNTRLPKDFAAMLGLVRDSNPGAQLIVCSLTNDLDVAPFVAPIVVPPLKERATEIPRIVDEYALDAMTALGAPLETFTSNDREWISEHASTSLPEIEKATLRLVALKTSSNLSCASERLGMAPVSLSRWLGRRK